MAIVLDSTVEPLCMVSSCQSWAENSHKWTHCSLGPRHKEELYVSPEAYHLVDKQFWCYFVYSCFEKGCPTKPYATMPKGIMDSGGSWSLIEALGVSAT